MDDKLQKSLDAMTNYLKNMTPEQEAEMKEFFRDDTPKGWVSVEDALPQMLATDITQGYTKYKVKYANGEEGESGVSDHNIWYYKAKEIGITHWYNE